MPTETDDEKQEKRQLTSCKTEESLKDSALSGMRIQRPSGHTETVSRTIAVSGHPCDEHRRTNCSLSRGDSTITTSNRQRESCTETVLCHVKHVVEVPILQRMTSLIVNTKGANTNGRGEEDRSIEKCGQEQAVPRSSSNSPNNGLERA